MVFLFCGVVKSIGFDVSKISENKGNPPEHLFLNIKFKRKYFILK